VEEMSGNVWESCLNEYGNPANFQEGGNARRVVRGGSWNYFTEYAAVSVRIDLFVDFNIFGFRVVCAPSPSKALGSVPLDSGL